MKRFVDAFWKVLLILVSLPLIKGFYDNFLTPDTGLLVVAGANEATLAFFTAVPWVFPVACAIKMIIDLSKPDDNEDRISYPKK